MEKVVLRQCMLALQTAQDARRTTYKVIEPIFSSVFEIQEHLRFVKAMQDFRDRLDIALPIVTLCEELYWSEAHRKRRAVQLIKDSAAVAHGICLPLVQTVRLEKSREAHTEFYRFRRAKEMLENASEILELCLDARKDGTEKIESSPQDSTVAPTSQEALAPSSVTVEEYFRPRLYHWVPSARKLLKMHDSERKQQLSELSLEGLATPYHSLVATQSPLYRGEVFESLGIHKYMKYDGINAIWQSPVFEKLGFTRTKDTYFRLLSAIVAKHEESKYLPTTINRVRTSGNICDPRYGTYTFEPVDLARACHELGFDLGLVFYDDSRTIVWPLARSNQEQRRSLLILCRDLNGVEYAALRLLKLNGAPAPRDARPWTFDEALREQYVAKPYGLAESLQGLADRAKPGWKPFPFLNLPAELRNRIYEVYLEGHKESITFAAMLNYDADNIPPPLCMASRQVRGEFLPVWRSSKELRVICKNSLGSMLNSRNRWMKSTPGGSSITRLDLVKVPSMETRIFRLRFMPTGYNTSWLERHSIGKHSQVFNELVNILSEDRTGVGLSLNEVELLRRFLATSVTR